MKRQHRGAVQDPVPDYHDTNRPNEKAAPVHPTKDSTRTAEKSSFSPFPNTYEEASDMSKFTPPEGFVPNYDPADPEQPNFWNGPCESGEGVDVLSEWTPDHGVRVIMGSTYAERKDILDLAQDLIRLYVAVDNAQREHEANTREVAL